MRFVKMHGIGNDYIYVNGFEQTVAEPEALARRIADRHFGVGGDGLVLVLPPEPGVDADVRMRIFNADGSEAEMCGNGIRCVCKLAHDHGLCRANPMRIQARSGVLVVAYETDAAGNVDQATVDLGEPVFDPARIPVNIPDLAQIVNHSIRKLVTWPPALPRAWERRCGLDPRMTCVSLGNPHVVLFCDAVASVPLDTVGPVLEHHPVFPNRINVHFAQVQGPHELTMRTWERGSGPTLACGTGAAAVCAAGVRTSRTDRTVTAHLPGGDLQLDWRKADQHVYLTGPAAEVFCGQWPD